MQPPNKAALAKSFFHWLKHAHCWHLNNYKARACFKINRFKARNVAWRSFTHHRSILGPIRLQSQVSPAASIVAPTGSKQKSSGKHVW